MPPARVELCRSDDFDALDRLAAVLTALGYRSDGEIAPGLNRFARGETGLTVFLDAWLADAVGPEDAVAELLAALASPDYE